MFIRFIINYWLVVNSFLFKISFNCSLQVRIKISLFEFKMFTFVADVNLGSLRSKFNSVFFFNLYLDRFIILEHIVKDIENIQLAAFKKAKSSILYHIFFLSITYFLVSPKLVCPYYFRLGLRKLCIKEQKWNIVTQHMKEIGLKFQSQEIWNSEWSFHFSNLSKQLKFRFECNVKLKINAFAL